MISGGNLGSVKMIVPFETLFLSWMGIVENDLMRSWQCESALAWINDATGCDVNKTLINSSFFLKITTPCVYYHLIKIALSMPLIRRPPAHHVQNNTAVVGSRNQSKHKNLFFNRNSVGRGGLIKVVAL